MKHFTAHTKTAMTLAAIALVATVATPVINAQSADDAAPWHVVLIGGTRSQGYLGVSFADISEEQVSSLKLKDAHGVEVTMIDHDGPACKAGLKEHDVILSMNGQIVEGEDHLRRLLHDAPPGRKVTFVISRDGREQAMNIQLANKADLEKNAWSQHFVVPDPGGDPAPKQESSIARFGDKFLPSPSIILGMPRIGVMLDPMEPQLAQFFGATNGKGLLVRSVEANSAAEHAGLKAGDVVIKVNGTTVATRNDWLRALRDSKPKPVAVTILRDKKEQILTVNMDDKKRSENRMPRELQRFELR